MTKQEAITAIEQGKTVRHPIFGGKYSMRGGEIWLEVNRRVTEWFNRFAPPTGWSIVE